MPVSTAPPVPPVNAEPVVNSDPPGTTGRTARKRMSVGVTLLPLQLFLLAGWARAGVEKLIDPAWWNAQYLRGFLEEQRADMLPWFGWITDHLLQPLAPQVAITVLVLQLSIAVCLATNFRVRHALWAGVVLNLCFVMAGRVNPSAFYLVMELTMLFALSRPVGVTIARRRAVLWMVPATLVLPFAHTLHPRDVIDDPALMLSFLGVAAAVTTLARADGLDQLLSDVASTRPGSVVVGFLGRLGLRFDVAELDAVRVSRR